MRLICGGLLVLAVAVIGSGCHHIRHVRDVRAVGEGKLEVEKCEYYINGFWGTGGDEGCRVETITVK